MKSAWTLCAILLLVTCSVAQTGTKPKTSTKKAAAGTITAADVQALKDAIAAQQSAITQQQQQIQELRDELRRKDQAVQQAQTAASDAAGKADAAQAVATQQQATVTELKGNVTDLQGAVANTVVNLQETQKSLSESPLALKYKGVTIIPVGFFAAETARRSRALAADVNTPFNALTMPGASQSAMSEFFASGRQSRIGMLAEGRLKSVKLSGYVEADFLSAGITSNNNQSNSYTLRQRQIWGQAAFDNGWSFTGGQMWSLVTETTHGLDNRTEALPMTIDAAYTAGFSWARQFGLRLVKNFNNKVWFGVSVENSQETVTTHNNAANFLIGSAGANGGVYNGGITTCSTSLNAALAPVTTCTPAASYSFNASPDVIAKAAFEPGFGHYEVFGIYSRFRDRVFPCINVSATAPCAGTTGPSPILAHNASEDGGGFGANARFSMYKKGTNRLDLGLHALYGSGIGRYGASGLADASITDLGTLHLIRSSQGLATLELRTSKLDFYFNAGAEYASRTASYDPVQKKAVGYGSPAFSNSGCFTETAPANNSGFVPGGLSSCTADTRVLIEGTAGFWYRFYNGPRGRFQFGPQYSYVTRNAWSGASGFEPHGIDNMVFTSFRYYLP
ncbi:MAG TPA: hypothetical protein VMG82_10445 [Candidatus Sulfotelmatobacter sp.]|nr:hypothetical protein [Candidatus Sulfotelmatobacter sp.]